MTNRLSDYNQRLESFLTTHKSVKKKQNPLPILRLATFLVFAVLIYIFLTTQTIWSGIAVIVVFALFVILSVYDNKLKKQLRHVEILISLNQKEINALNGNYSSFSPGNEFIDQSHNYTHDLDIFGDGSLFQFINRTATIFGRLQLAEYLSKAFDQSDKVIQRQNAVKELSAMIDLRQKMQLIFHDEKITQSDKTEMTEWLQSESPVRNLKFLRILAFGLPSITIVCILLSIFGLIAFPGLLIVLQWIIVILYARQTIKIQSIITSKSNILNKYALGLLLIEKSNFKSEYLIELHKQLLKKEGEIPSKAIHQLAVLLKYMDSNLNILVSVFLNGLFMFNLHMLLKVENWKEQNKYNVPKWFDSIATFDALCSLANFSYNHPEYAYPVPTTEEFVFSAEQLGHPLISEKNRVVNDLKIEGWNQFSIITGANMSGKSTFLRTVGVNYVLAMAGAPVCALKLSFFPIQIHSSIRTSDSLTRNESYFYAELKRLKQIIDELKDGKKQLILLDEILKGTNSKDKQAGSIALIEQLIHYQSVGLFATHDLMLGELQERFPQQVKNLCFEIEIKGDKMVIDYKLHHGVCKNLNATYLMLNMGILIKDDK